MLFINKSLIIKKGDFMKKSILLFAVISSLYFLSYVSNAQTPEWTWANSAGGNGNEYGFVAETDMAGNVLLSGSFNSSTITFGAFTLVNAGDGHSDMFIVKYNTSGDVLWAKSSGAIGIDIGNWACPDASGNVYEIGAFYDNTITFGSVTLTNNNINTYTTSDIFFVKYDANGNVLWAKGVGGTSNDRALCIDINSSGDVYITGDFYSPSMTFGTTTLTNTDNSGNTADFFLAKYDTNGNLLWAKSTGGTGDDSGNEVCADASGNTYIEGEFNSPTLIFGSTSLTNADNTGNTDDSFLVKYDADGNVIWAKSISGSASDDAVTIGIDTSGNAYVAGMFNSPTLTFGSTTLTNAGQWDMFLAKYNVDGNVLWAKSAGGNSYDQACHLNVDFKGNVSLIGAFYSPSITFGTTTLTNTDNIGNTEDMFIVQYDANGNVNWAISAGGSVNDWGVGCTTDEFGNVYISGLFYSSTLTFGSSTLINADNTGNTYDLFIAKLGNNTGTNELSNLLNISVYPNPSNAKFTITFPSTTRQIRISNSLGQVMQTKCVDKETNVEFELSENGIYIIQIKTDKQTITKKVVICR
jgi:hypothetical protein